MIVGTAGRRGRMLLSKAVRAWLDMQEGNHVVFSRWGDEVVLQPLTHTLADLRGSVAVSGPQDFAGTRQEVVEAHVCQAIAGEIECGAGDGPPGGGSG
jgi:hypothetical protein